MLWASTYSASYQVCEAERASSYGNAHEDDFLYEIAAFFVCEGVTLDDNAELLTALATGAIAWFTLTLWQATTAQGRITTAALNLATREFVATQRPKLRIRLLKLRKPEFGKPLRIDFVVFNVGNTPARNVEAEITVEARDVQVRIDRTTVRHETKRWTGLADVERSIAAGDAIDASKETPLIFEQDWWDRTPVIPDDWAWDRVVVIGRIIYADDNGVKRRTAFYRFCTKDVNRFRLPDFPPVTLGDHEYED